MNLLPLSLLVVHISQRAVSKHFRPFKYIYMERDTEKLIYIHIERHKYVHVQMLSFEKKCFRGVVGLSEDEGEGLVKRVKACLENQYFIQKETHGFIICTSMYKPICVCIFRPKYIFISMH